MNNSRRYIAAAVLAVFFAPAWAQNEHAGHGAMSPPPKDPHAGHGNAAEAAEPAKAAEHAGHAPAPESSTPMPDVRDPHAYAGGYEFSQFPMRHAVSDINFGLLLIDRLEAVRSNDNTAAAVDLQASYGGSFNRALLKFEGEVDSGELEDASSELLWSHAVAPMWNSQIGLRHDSGEGPDRGWLAVGIQGLAPYWFEVDATAYVGEQGRGAINLEADYDLLLTQRWILQPRVETNLYSKADSERGLGKGLSDTTLGVRLRYEIRREIAPYIGLEWAARFGDTADYARAAELDTRETRSVAGVRFWF